MNELDDPTLLRLYLLGTLNDEIVQTQIEERLMVDEEFAFRVGVAEDELIEQFLDGELTAEESDHFNRFFLAPPERKRQLRLTRDLRRVSASQPNVSPHQLRSRSVHSTGWLRFAVLAVAVVIAAVGVWRFAIYESDVDKGLGELQAAYRDRRPVESRITGLNAYAPYSETRGSESAVTDPAALDRANRFLIDATSGTSDAAPHHALAIYYLTTRDFERAEREMNIALKSSPNSTRLQSDAGAMYLEMAKDATSRGDDARMLVLLNESLRHLDAAIAGDPRLLEARYNRALALERLMSTEEAKSAWQEFLKLDSNSKWADEAKQHLQTLERETPRERSDVELESDFIAAFRAGNEAEATNLISNNRELIRDKYLPMRLSMSAVSVPEERRDELLRALEYTGDLELNLTGDTFAKEVAFFYRNLSKEKRETLLVAHQELRRGLQYCLEPNYANALESFRNARTKFESSGDMLNGNLAGYLIAYSLKNLTRLDEALGQFTSVEEWATQRNFRWLQMTSMHWIAQCALDKKELTSARRSFEDALALADSMNDSYGRQRNQIMLATLHSLCGQEQASLRYLVSALRESDKPETSLRQRYRNLFLAFPIMFEAKLFNIGKPTALEFVWLADQLKERMWIPQSRAFAGTAAGITGDAGAARALFDESRAKAGEIKVDATRELVTALTNLKAADLERSLGNYDAARELYEKASAFYDGVDQPPMFREQAHQGLLLTYLSAGRSNELEQQISLNIGMLEDYRSRLDADMSLGFFDRRGNVYDVAAEFEFDRGNLEKAYDYAEASSSRSLFDQMQMRSGAMGASLVLGKPLDLKTVRAQMPRGVQILQYSVFEKKLIAWIVSRDSFHAIPISITRSELQDRVSEFAKVVSRETTLTDSEKNPSTELFGILIAPALPYLNVENELCIIPNGVLFDLPFAALASAGGEPIIASFKLSYAPSANVFLQASKSAAERATTEPESVLAVGNPAFPDDRPDKLPRLPDAENEAIEVARVYPNSVKLLANGATKSAFLRSIASADVVHFAGHYVMMPGAPMSSYLLLAADGDDGSKSELSNRELQNVSMPRTRLMVFAACDSGIEGYYRSEGIAGMARTMLASRIPLVVASQWNVDSAATAQLMIRFHELRRRDSMSTTAALREAQLELLNDPTGRFRSPYYWAAFAVYGGHAEF